MLNKLTPLLSIHFLTHLTVLNGTSRQLAILSAYDPRPVFFYSMLYQKAFHMVLEVLSVDSDCETSCTNIWETCWLLH